MSAQLISSQKEHQSWAKTIKLSQWTIITLVLMFILLAALTNIGLRILTLPLHTTAGKLLLK